KLPVSLVVCVQRLDYTAPIRVLAVIDFAEIQHWPLHHLAASTALALHNAPVTVVFSCSHANPDCTHCVPPGPAHSIQRGRQNSFRNSFQVTKKLYLRHLAVKLRWGYTFRTTAVPDLSGIGTMRSGLSAKNSSTAFSAPSQYRLE